MTMNEENISIKGKLIKNIYHKDNFDVSLFKVDGETLKVVSKHDNYEFNNTYLLTGNYEENRYGLQFNASSAKIIIEDSKAIVDFLSSSKFPGIGKKTILKLIESLGLDLISKIEKKPSVLDGLSYLSDIKKSVLIAGIKGLNALDDITLWLYSLGLSENASYNLIEKYGEETKNIVLENPYIICQEVEYVGFKLVDKIALDLGVDPNSNERLIEGVRYLLNEEAYSNGNTYVLLDYISTKVIKLLKIDKTKEYIISFLNELNYKDFNIIDDKIFLRYIYNNELSISYKLNKILGNKVITKISNNKLSEAIKSSEKEYGISLTKGQYSAIVDAFNNNISIITGGPGTGKTTIVKFIVNIYSHYFNDNILICAPTGRAAKRLCSFGLSAVTIHRALGYDGENFIFSKYNYLPYKLIIIDESSMIDVNLAYSLLSATDDSTKLIFLGDANQLPSVGPGNFLKDMISSNVINVNYLTEILRQKEDSNIISLANMILNNNLNLDKLSFNKDIFYYSCDKNNYSKYLKTIYENYISNTNNDNDDLQIIIPKYDGETGINNTNNFIQDCFYKNKSSICIGSKLFYKGDRVIQTKNNYEIDVMNGDQGTILNLNDDILVSFEKPTTLSKSNMHDLDLAYAISVHKSQGSEFNNVILPLFRSYGFMLTKKLIYTALTRAKVRLIIIGDIGLLYRLTEYDYNRNSYLIKLLDPNLNSSNQKTIAIEDKSIVFDEIIDDLNVSPMDFLYDSQDK